MRGVVGKREQEVDKETGDFTLKLIRFAYDDFGDALEPVFYPEYVVGDRGDRLTVYSTRSLLWKDSSVIGVLVDTWDNCYARNAIRLEVPPNPATRTFEDYKRVNHTFCEDIGAIQDLSKVVEEKVSGRKMGIELRSRRKARSSRSRSSPSCQASLFMTDCSVLLDPNPSWKPSGTSLTPSTPVPRRRPPPSPRWLRRR